MELQKGIATSLDRKLEGQTLTVLIERIEDGTTYARTEYDAPEVDNDVIIEIGDEAVTAGEFRQVIIEDSTAYELFGRISEK
jgi:ribosomal protein S12 methylthiotransferase